MSVWVCVPSARPVAEVRAWVERWHERGYKVAIWRDPGASCDMLYDFCQQGHYPGYALATNELIKWVLDNDSSCDWVLAGGDDVFPDASHTAEEIAAQCSIHFETLLAPFPARAHAGAEKLSTFGVVQPTGDRWGDDAAARARWPDAPAMIDRICGSPWIGREFARRVNGGRGPFWPEYFHNWCDQEVQEVAIKLGVFWQRRDLIHYHNHSRRQGGPWLEHQKGFDADYVKMKPLFEKRKAAGWPGHEAIA